MLGSRVRDLRLAHGLSQADLAARASVSRQLVGALEAGRHLPRVDAAAAIARALGTSVEALIAPASMPVVGAVEDPSEGAPVRVARVGELLVCVAASPAGESWSPADGVVREGQVRLLEGERPAGMVAGCDPALGLISRSIEADGGPGVVVAASSSVAALAALAAGRVHAAVVHGVAGDLPGSPIGLRRWRLATWQVGLAAPVDLPEGWQADAIAGRLTVVQREPGAGSQAAFARAVAAHGRRELPPGPISSGHLDAAGWARRAGHAAVTIEPAAAALGMAFHALEEHNSEIWVAPEHLDVAGVRRLMDEVAGARLRQRLAAIGGYDVTGTGTELVA